MRNATTLRFSFQVGSKVSLPKFLCAFHLAACRSRHQPELVTILIPRAWHHFFLAFKKQSVSKYDIIRVKDCKYK